MRKFRGFKKYHAYIPEEAGTIPDRPISLLRGTSLFGVRSGLIIACIEWKTRSLRTMNTAQK
jgi:hypothetical protein